jgi:hypothetical protein
MIEAGKSLGQFQEIRLVDLEPTAGNFGFLRALECSARLDIELGDRTATIRRLQ